MSNMPEIIGNRIGPLVEPLHAAFELARYRLDSDYRGLCRDDQQWMRSHILRGLTHQQLTDDPLPEHWSLAGNHNLNGSVVLTYGSGQMTLRFVHAFPSGSSPIAGPNRARRAYFTNSLLADFSDPLYMPTQRLLLVWEEFDPESPFELTVVHPLAPGSLRRAVHADLQLPLPRTRTAFEQLHYDTADDDENLYFDFDEAGDTGTDDER